MKHRLPAPSQSGAAHARNVGSLLFRSLYRLNVLGAHHVPQRGPVILAANHLGLLDGPLLVAASPRPVHALAKSELFTPELGPALRWLGQISVEYQQPDRTALQEAVAALASGLAVGIFPEGHRSRGDVAAVRNGVGYLAAHVPGAPVVPVAILGTRATGQGAGHVPAVGSRLHVVFGEPVLAGSPVGDAEPVLAGSAVTSPVRLSDVQRATETVHRALAEHVRRAVQHCGVDLPADTIAH